MNSDDRYDYLFVRYGNRYNVPPLLLKAQVKAESEFDPSALSSVGAMGLAQFMPPTWKEWSEKLGIADADPLHPEHSIHCQAAYMDWLIKCTGGGERALAAYNWGIGNYRRCTVEHGDAWRDHLPDETKDYIEKIQRQFAEYSK